MSWRALNPKSGSLSLEAAISFSETFDASRKELNEKMDSAVEEKENVEKAIYENLDDVVKAKVSKLMVEVATASASNEGSKHQLLKFPKPSDELVATHKEVNACFLEILGSAIGEEKERFI